MLLEKQEEVQGELDKLRERRQELIQKGRGISRRMISCDPGQSGGIEIDKIA